MTSLIRNRAFRRLWLGQSIALTADQLFTTTIALWVGTVLLRGESYAPAATAAMMGLAAAATVGVAPVAGVLVDRWVKVRVVLTVDVVRMLISWSAAALPWLSATAPLWLTLGACGLAVVVQAVAAQFFNPARMIILSDAVPPAQRERAAGFAQAGSATAMIAGPMAAGLLFVVAGPGLGLALNGLCYASSFLAFRGTTSPAGGDHEHEQERRHLGREALASLTLIARSRVLRSVLGAGVIVMLGASVVSTLNIYFVQENLHADQSWFGAITSSLGAGLLLGALGAAALSDRLGTRLLFAGGLLLCGLACLTYSRLVSAPAAAVTIFVYGLAGGIVETVMAPLILGATRRDHLARVLSVFTSVLRLSSIAALGAAGWLASLLPATHALHVLGLTFGRIDLIFLGAATMLLIAGGYVAVSLRTDRA